MLLSVEFAGVSTSRIKCGDSVLLVYGGKTSTLTKSFLTIVFKFDQKVVVISDGEWHNIYIYHSRLSQDIFVQPNCCEGIHCSCIKAWPVVSQRSDQSGYRVIHDEDEMEPGPGVYMLYSRRRSTLLNNLQFWVNTQAFSSENRANECAAIWEAILLWIMASENESEYLWINILYTRNWIPDWTERRVTC